MTPLLASHVFLPQNGKHRQTLLSAIKDRRQPPQMSVLVTDCCNVASPPLQIPQSPTVQPPAMAAPLRDPILHHLIFEHSGWINLTSSRKGQYSWCEKQKTELGETIELGGFFTNALIEVVGGYSRQAAVTGGGKRTPGWDTVFEDVRRATGERFDARHPAGIKLQDGQRYRTQTPYMYSTYGPTLAAQRDLNGIRFGAGMNGNSNAVARVIAGTAAARAGLKPGDRILHFENWKITDFNDFSFAVDKSPRQVSIQYRRNARLKSALVKLPY